MPLGELELVLDFVRSYDEENSKCAITDRDALVGTLTRALGRAGCLEQLIALEGQEIDGEVFHLDDEAFTFRHAMGEFMAGAAERKQGDAIMAVCGHFDLSYDDDAVYPA
jgi:hypothetical protein